MNIPHSSLTNELIHEVDIVSNSSPFVFLNLHQVVSSLTSYQQEISVVETIIFSEATETLPSFWRPSFQKTNIMKPERMPETRNEK